MSAPVLARVEAVLTGRAVDYTRPGSRSAIAKQPVPGPVAVGTEGLHGDEQGDRRVHGGPDKAIHHYPREHYAAWRGEIGAHPLLDGPGAFGENISTTGLVEADLGHVVFEVLPGEQHYNPIGVVHGGLAMTLLDSAMGCSVHSHMPAGGGYTTLEAKTNLVRPITSKTGLLRAIGKAVHVGKRVATAEGRLVDGAGKLYAHATTTCIVLGQG